ncbi:hypothetical protein CEXT_759661 [Caerostris extrusa]|uniref:Uncharacterized protein n=1 Tax=Caerostris extrusa TaxID=172846 RepID=A0AAV4NZC8_CAEEX|nr:hypothetical protein CEXT_759661 [Caerostris extrusa]
MEFNGSENSPVNHCSPNRKAYTEPILPKVNLIASLAETLGKIYSIQFSQLFQLYLDPRKTNGKEIGKKEKKKEINQSCIGRLVIKGDSSASGDIWPSRRHETAPKHVWE